MTSTLLAQKIMSVKLSSAEFKNLKLLRANNKASLSTIIAPLKKMIDNQIRNRTCRLCLKPGKIKIFDDKGVDYVRIMKVILQIEVKENDGKPQHICSDCETVLINVDRLKQTAEITQWRLQQELDIVANTTLDDDKSYEGRWACERCRRTFKTQEALTRHQERLKCHNRRLASVVCETCGLELKTASLKAHRLTHTAPVLRCSQCPYRGRTKQAMERHERSHSGIRPKACPHCPATFIDKSNLNQHIKTHFPPTFHCDICGKSFKYKAALRYHHAAQHGFAKYVCETCGKTLKTQSELRKHERKVHNRPKMKYGVLPAYLRQHEYT